MIVKYYSWTKLESLELEPSDCLDISGEEHIFNDDKTPEIKKKKKSQNSNCKVLNISKKYPRV